MGSESHCSNLIRELIAIIAHTHTHKNSQLLQEEFRIQLINGYLPTDDDEGENHYGRLSCFTVHREREDVDDEDGPPRIPEEALVLTPGRTFDSITSAILKGV